MGCRCDSTDRAKSIFLPITIYYYYYEVYIYIYEVIFIVSEKPYAEKPYAENPDTVQNAFSQGFFQKMCLRSTFQPYPHFGDTVNVFFVVGMTELAPSARL